MNKTIFNEDSDRFVEFQYGFNIECCGRGWWGSVPDPSFCITLNILMDFRLYQHDSLKYILVRMEKRKTNNRQNRLGSPARFQRRKHGTVHAPSIPFHLRSPYCFQRYPESVFLPLTPAVQFQTFLTTTLTNLHKIIQFFHKDCPRSSQNCGKVMHSPLCFSRG